jgi:DNA-binding FrmR family transcriptional regulator
MSAELSNPFASETAALNAEHISLQSETVEVAAKPITRKPLIKYQLRSRARGSITRVSILEGHFVQINIKRPRLEAQEHTVDLRFVDPRPIGIRKVGWPWIYVAVGLTLLAATAGAFAVFYASPFARVWAVPLAIVLGTFTVSSYLMCLYSTTETLVFVSQHGRARVIPITGGLGTTRAARKCAIDIVKHISASRKAFKQSRAHYLRDEMREHSRLRDAGAINEEQYEDSISRILKAHN